MRDGSFCKTEIVASDNDNEYNIWQSNIKQSGTVVEKESNNIPEIPKGFFVEEEEDDEFVDNVFILFVVPLIIIGRYSLSSIRVGH